MTIKEEVLKEMGMDYKALRRAIDLTLKKVEELFDENGRWNKHRTFFEIPAGNFTLLKQKLRGGKKE